MGLALWRVCKILCVKASPSCWTQRGWSGQGASYVFGVETVGDFVCVYGAEGARARLAQEGTWGGAVEAGGRCEAAGGAPPPAPPSRARRRTTGP